MNTALYLIYGTWPYLYLLAAVFISYKLYRRFQRTRPGWGFGKRSLTTAAILIAILLVPSWPILTAYGYMYVRCGQDGGIQVIRTIEVDAEEFFPLGHLSPDWKSTTVDGTSTLCVGDYCFLEHENKEIMITLPFNTSIVRYIKTYREKRSNQILATLVRYRLNSWYYGASARPSCPKLGPRTRLSGNLFVRGSGQ